MSCVSSERKDARPRWTRDSIGASHLSSRSAGLPSHKQAHLPVGVDGSCSAAFKKKHVTRKFAQCVERS